MTVYLIHFERRYEHAGHYLGSSNDLDRRLAEHRAGRGARLMEVITEEGIDWQVVRTWEGGRDVEMALKRRHSGVRLCPICTPAVVLALAQQEEAHIGGLVENEISLLEDHVEQTVCSEQLSLW